MTDERAPVTAIVASRNEARLLEQRLRELEFCDEVIVIDIDSRDDTAAVAEAHGVRVVRHAYVPIAERARVEVAREARHDWLLLVDPDEELPPALAEDVKRFLRDAPDDVGVVTAPIVYLFRGRPLRGTVWGAVGRRPLLVRRSGTELSTAVHQTMILRRGFRIAELGQRDDNVIRHHWTSGYLDWIEKHRRYLRLEGSSRADAGFVTGYRGVARMPWRSFHDSFVARRGYADGLRGFALSALWALYSTATEIALLRELRRRARLQ
jgi:glycosyltransferase involved in cell wall biosynthesis